MIKIDGSLGGGQLLRTAVGLSALTRKAVKIEKIRMGRAGCKPGLRPQHIVGIKAVGEFCNAEIKGNKENSLEVEFIPQKLNVKSHKIDVGTAGSISLVLQTLLPLLIAAKKRVRLDILGGTETRWSPPIQYFQYITLPNLRKIGANVKIEVKRHGYYPKGGGEVVVDAEPYKKLLPFQAEVRGRLKAIHVESVVSNLPKEIAERQGRSAMENFKSHCPEAELSITYKRAESLSPGTSITCCAVCENSFLGGSELGERGVRAEAVGMKASDELLRALKTNATFDRYMGDQILPFLALADGRSNISVEEVTNHIKTNIHVIEKFLPVKFEVEGNKIGVKGAEIL